MSNIKIDNLSLNEDFNYYILVETAFSHEGDINYLKKQIESASKGKADGVKFQILLDVEDSYKSNTEIFQNFSEWSISEDQWIKIFKFAKSKGLDIIVLPIDLKALEFAKENIKYIDAIEIHSICFNEVPYLNVIKTIPINLILGIGGRTIDDIDFIIERLSFDNSSLDKKKILMYGFQSFPTDYKELNLSKLKSLKDRYKMTLGYADHTSYENYKIGNEIIKYSFLLGARLFEKHIVLERGKKRIDYESAISYIEFLELRNELNTLIDILGNKDLTKLNEIEENYRKREKQLIAKIDLKKGAVLSENNIGYKVSKEKSDFEQKQYKELINKKIIKDIKKNNVFKFEHFE